MRGNHRRLLAIGLTAALTVGCASTQSPTPQPSGSATSSGSPAGSPVAESPLDGIWITPRLTRDKVAAALTAHGFGQAELDYIFPTDLVVDWYMAELVIDGGRWVENDIADAVNVGGQAEGSTDFVNGSTVVVSRAEDDCATTYHYTLASDQLDLQVAGTTCSDAMTPAIEKAIYESAPFHRADRSGVVLTEAPVASPSSGPGTSTSADRLSLRPIGSVPGAPLGFAEYLPPGYGHGSASPLLVHLHGSGESGRGDELALNQLFSGSHMPVLIRENEWPDDRPFVVLMPQHLDQAPANCFTPDEINAFLKFALAHYHVDPARVYLTGVSCGAIGGWNYLGAHTDEIVAAAVLIAGNGYGAVDQAGCSLGRVPIWAFHGGLDDRVTPNGSEYPIGFLQRCTDPPAADARLTVYPSSGHDVWSQTYAVSTGLDIYAWLLGHQRQGPGA